MAAGVGAPYYGVEITDFNNLVVGQTYKYIAGPTNGPFPAIPKIVEFLGTEIAPYGSTRYRFRKLDDGTELKLSGYSPIFYRVFQHATGGVRRQRKTRRQNKRRSTRRRAYRR